MATCLLGPQLKLDSLASKKENKGSTSYPVMTKVKFFLTAWSQCEGDVFVTVVFFKSVALFWALLTPYPTIVIVGSDHELAYLARISDTQKKSFQVPESKLRCKSYKRAK